MTAIDTTKPKTFPAIDPYQNCIRLIQWHINRFLALHPCDLDDLWSICHESYMKAAQSFNPEKRVKFQTWLGQRIWWDMLEYWRTETKNREHCIGHGWHFPANDDPQASWQERCEDISDDAKALIESTLEAVSSAAFIPIAGSHLTAHFRKSVIDNVQDDRGWSWKRMKEAVSEVRALVQ